MDVIVSLRSVGDVDVSKVAITVGGIRTHLELVLTNLLSGLNDRYNENKDCSYTYMCW